MGFKSFVLKTGELVKVSREDAARIRGITWYRTGMVGNYYVQGYIDGKKIPLHRFLKGLPPHDPQIVDHKNRDPFDNRRSNLRFATRSQNCMNAAAPKRIGSTSKFKGVCFHKRDRRWQAQAGKKYLGFFNTEVEAAIAYDRWALKAHGKFACLNFPKENYL